ncbi:MAG TPA: PqqD family protein [Bdellovibrionota bacterium]|nr:PqqD family protein [Bdellovibrionota bacterium]
MSYAIDEKKVIYADLDPTEGIVLNLETKNYYRLNETGQIIWQQLSAGKNPDEVAADLCKRYNTSLERALADTNELVEQMKRERLIQSQSAPPADYSVEQARKSKKENPIRST